MREVAISGSDGFLGSHLCRHLHGRGFRVRALLRQPEDNRWLEPYCEGGLYRCNLPSDIDSRAFAEPVDVLIHCAYSMRLTAPRLAWQINVGGSEALLRLSRDAGVRCFCFVSSLSSHLDAKSLYGRSKLEIERKLDLTRDVVVRPGLIVGRGGVFEGMRRAVARCRVIPLLHGGDQTIQTVDVDDLCVAIERIVSARLSGRFSVADEGIPFRMLLERLARSQGRRIRFINIPVWPLHGLLWLAERLGIRLPFSTDNLLGLKSMQYVDTREDLRRIGIRLRPLEASLQELRVPSSGF